MERMESHTEMERIFPTVLHHVLVAADTGCLKGFTWQLFILIRHHVNTEWQVIYTCLLAPQIINPYFGIYTKAKHNFSETSYKGSKEPKQRAHYLEHHGKNETWGMACFCNSGNWQKEQNKVIILNKFCSLSYGPHSLWDNGLCRINIRDIHACAFCLCLFTNNIKGKILAHDWLIQLSSCFSVTMASSFDIINEEYIEELKDKRKNEHEESHGVMKERFQKVGKWKKLASKLRRARRRCPRTMIVPVWSIQKFSNNSALYVMNK